MNSYNDKSWKYIHKNFLLLSLSLKSDFFSMLQLERESKAKEEWNLLQEEIFFLWIRNEICSKFNIVVMEKFSIFFIRLESFSLSLSLWKGSLLWTLAR